MEERRYLPTLAELIDRLSICQLKEVFIVDHKDEYAKEIQDILHDIDLCLKNTNEITAETIRAIVVLSQMNLHIWHNEANYRKGIKDGNNLELTHGLNGIRNTAKNKIQEIVGGRKDYKLDCLAADFKNWEISWNSKNELEFQKLISSANRLCADGNFIEAISKLDEALIISPDNKYVKKRKKEIDDILKKKYSDELNQYDNLIHLADQLCIDGDIKKSIIKFKEALKIRPNGEYPKKRINEIKKERYDELISLAHKLYEDKSYIESVEALDEAFSIIPSDDISNQIREIHSKVISIANEYFLNFDYKNALKFYEDSLLIYPDDEYPKTRIKELQAIKTDVSIL